MNTKDKDISISGIHVDLTDSLKSIVHNKAQKLFNHNGKIIRINVNLEYNANKSKSGEFIAHGEIEIGGPNLIATAVSDDLYKSIDQMIDKLDRQLTNKNKVENDRNKEKSTSATQNIEIASTILE